MITRNLRVAAAVGVAALDSTISGVSSFSFSAMGAVMRTATNMEQNVGWQEANAITNTQFRTTSITTALCMGRGGGVRTRGLEKRREGPTPTEGGMVLYLKAAEDGKSVGDCPFAHYIRMILEEKGLPYTVEPCAGQEDKPGWLLDHYEGKLPCLRHKKEAYVESNVIAAYLDYFFPADQQPTKDAKVALEDADDALVGFFPALAGYLKDAARDGDESAESLSNLRDKLSALEDHLSETGYLDLSGDEKTFGVLDCRLVPQLYHLKVGIDKFKQGIPNLETEFPKIHGYLSRSMERPSFKNTLYAPETIEWGWSNARQ